MSQIHTPVIAPPARAARGRAAAAALSARWVDAVIIVALVAAAYGIVSAASRWVAPLSPSVHIDLSPAALPVYAGLSTLRMALAYLLSLAFSLIYARIAAASRSAERAMVPVPS